MLTPGGWKLQLLSSPSSLNRNSASAAKPVTPWLVAVLEMTFIEPLSSWWSSLASGLQFSHLYSVTDSCLTLRVLKRLNLDSVRKIFSSDVNIVLMYETSKNKYEKSSLPWGLFHYETSTNIMVLTGVRRWVLRLAPRISCLELSTGEMVPMRWG